MRLIVALLWVATAAAADCEVYIRGDAYREDVITAEIEYPFSMAVDQKTNTLYFSYHDYKFLAGKIDLGTKTFSRILELNGPCSFTVDQIHHAVYAGCFKFEVDNLGGLYQYDSNIGRFVLIGEENKSVKFVYYKEVLYYSLEDSGLLRTFNSGRSALVQELSTEVKNMVIDNDHNKIFYNSSGLFRQKAKSMEVTHYHDIFDPMALAIDERGDTFLCDYKTANMYLLDKQNASFTFVIGVSRCHGITFDSYNNIIYSNIGDHRISTLRKCLS